MGLRLQEVDKAVAAMVALLEPRLADASTPLPEAAEALHILLQLQADKAPCAAEARPLELYLTTLVCLICLSQCPCPTHACRSQGCTATACPVHRQPACPAS